MKIKRADIPKMYRISSSQLSRDIAKGHLVPVNETSNVRRGVFSTEDIDKIYMRKSEEIKPEGANSDLLRELSRSAARIFSTDISGVKSLHIEFIVRDEKNINYKKDL